MTDLTREPLHGSAIYNPHLLSKKELLSLFVARRTLLDRLLERIKEARPGSAPQHHLLLGARGMGKTMLLHRLRHAVDDDPALEPEWLALTFPEEQYDVSSVSDFWLNCVDALGDSLEVRGETQKAEELDATLEALLSLPEEERGRGALNLLLTTATEIGKRLVLLIDNIDLILQRIGTQAWSFREVLSEEASLLLIGASSQLMEATYEYDQPFYEFFEIHELRGLTLEKTREFLLHYANLWNNDAVRQVAQGHAGRLRTLHTLTGGNPRTITILYNILARGLDGDVRSDLEALLDQHTPLYKARVEALPEQAQKVLHALAIHWHPATARQVAEGARLDVNRTSSQLNRLVRSGLVEKVELPQRRSGFQISERFFNIWYLMRSTRRARRRLLWLVEFLHRFYSPEPLRSRSEFTLSKLETKALAKIFSADESTLSQTGSIVEEKQTPWDASELIEELDHKEFLISISHSSDGSDPQLRAIRDDLVEAAWLKVSRFFGRAVADDLGDEALRLVHELHLADRLQPLREALVVATANDRRHLLSLAPEIRRPTEEILEQFASIREEAEKTTRREPQRSAASLSTSVSKRSAAPSSKRS